MNVFARDAVSRLYAPLGRSAGALPLEGGLAHVLESSEAPLLTEPTGRRSAFGWLPIADRHWILDNGVAAAVAMAEISAGIPAFIATGPKKADLPWSREDLSFLAACASAAALVLASVAARDLAPLANRATHRTDPESADCRACGRVQPRTGDRCACGGCLEPSALPLTLNGKFTVNRVLGRGAMGVVYAAVDLELDRTVALKTLPRISPDAAFRLRREARSMATLIHPHLALIFGAESWRGVPVLVVEYLGGGTLRQRLGSPWPAEAAVSLGIALAGGLEAMHLRGLLHRDVKPSNVAFTEEGAPKLLDFGLAEIAGDLDQAAPVIVAGTRQYLSPEALRGVTPTVAQDLWALAVVFYEVLAGRAMPSRAGQHIPDVRRIRPCPWHWRNSSKPRSTSTRNGAFRPRSLSETAWLRPQVTVRITWIVFERLFPDVIPSEAIDSQGGSMAVWEEALNSAVRELEKGARPWKIEPDSLSRLRDTHFKRGFRESYEKTPEKWPKQKSKVLRMAKWAGMLAGLLAEWKTGNPQKTTITLLHLLAAMAIVKPGCGGDKPVKVANPTGGRKKTPPMKTEGKPCQRTTIGKKAKAFLKARMKEFEVKP